MVDRSLEKLDRIDLENFSYNLEEISTRLDIKEDWASLIACHIYIDHILAHSIREELAVPSAYFNAGHKSFSDKVSLCEALGLFPVDYLRTLRKLNTIRNKFAHELKFEMSNEEKTELFKQFSPNRKPSDVLSHEGFRDFLITLIIYAELDRLYSAKERSLTAKKEKVIEEMLARFREQGSQFFKPSSNLPS